MKFCIACYYFVYHAGKEGITNGEEWQSKL